MAAEYSTASAPSLAAPSAPPLREGEDRPEPPGTQPISPSNPQPTASESANANLDPDEMDTLPVIPTVKDARPTSSSSSGPVPLDSPLRTMPIHPSIAAVKVPGKARKDAPDTNPITLQPFKEQELAKYGYEKLRAQIAAAAKTEVGTPGLGSAGFPVSAGLSEKQKDEIGRIREETVTLLKQKLDEREGKIREIDREMEEKEKIREVERKVFRKKLGGGKGDA